MRDEDRIRRMVRRVVYRTVGMSDRFNAVRSRRLVTELDIRDLPFGSTFEVAAQDMITPLARQVAMDRRVEFVIAGEQAATSPVSSPVMPSVPVSGSQVVALGADHGGFSMKAALHGFLQELGYAVIDCGTDSESSVDYPDYAYAVAQLVSQGKAWRGIIVDGAGIGSCMAANKVPGVRAAMCYDQATAVNSRAHNDANVLTLGAGLIGVQLAKQITQTWLSTLAGGGRHARRVQKIMDIEKRHLK